MASTQMYYLYYLYTVVCKHVSALRPNQVARTAIMISQPVATRMRMSHSSRPFIEKWRKPGKR